MRAAKMRVPSALAVGVTGVSSVSITPTSIPGSLSFSSTTREEKEREPGIEVAITQGTSGNVTEDYGT